ncbi:MAG TPA: hypothetical protein RMH99_33215 [Sandaracinaceae bacterium LLY-WYZ-13_1]|nr:hypothetical protein [Sandaracinaceae bacterium LLY-WYZ-13_1]
MARGGSDRPVPDGGRTMQLDAVVDDLEEVAPPDVGTGRPPPLPPKKPKTALYVVAGIVILLAAGLGVGAGAVLLGDDPAPEGAAAPPPDAAPGEAQPATAEAAETAPPADEPADEAEGEEDVVEVEAFVIDHEGE